ncbi:protein of unknown function [Ruminococcaceae bacterium BL-4]|nr:protein of unknown function [Ruminococcaceae bacterium BL-4]
MFCQTHNFSFLETYVNSLSGESFDNLTVEVVENHPQSADFRPFFELVCGKASGKCGIL